MNLGYCDCVSLVHIAGGYSPPLSFSIKKKSSVVPTIRITVNSGQTRPAAILLKVATIPLED